MFIVAQGQKPALLRCSSSCGGHLFANTSSNMLAGSDQGPSFTPCRKTPPRRAHRLTTRRTSSSSFRWSSSRPGVGRAEVTGQPGDRVAERPRGGGLLGPVGVGVVRGGVRARAIGDHSMRAWPRGRPLARSAAHSVTAWTARVIVAVDADRRDAEADCHGRRQVGAAPRDTS